MNLPNKHTLIELLTASVCFMANLCGAHADDQAERDWKAFRKEFPFHIQTIALSPQSKSGFRTVIVSEPPPDTTLEEIKQAAPVTMGAAAIMQHPIGVDGWVKDVVATIPENTTAFSSEITSLSSYLFGTAYKAYVLQLPIDSNSQAKLNLDVQIGAHELRAWLGEKSKFRTLSNDADISPTQIYGSKQMEVYYSSEPGLVLWWVPRDTKLSEHRATIRQFALDSDLLVGGLVKQNGILVIARERSTPLETVQPLRTETIILLANVNEDELKQSYERTYPLAGRFDAEREWAPILLSGQLRHTELGSLLNITDQLLKGWSEGGTVEYYNFPYAKPSHYPFFNPGKPNEPRSLFFLLGEQIDSKEGRSFSSLVYNWNTVGAGYSFHYPDAEVYAMNRTGALPVTYLPEGSTDDSTASKIVQEAMETGYAYYAALEDINLARVFEYAALYQLFCLARSTGKWESTETVSSQSQPEKALRNLFVNALTEMRDDPDKILAALAKRSEKTSAKAVSELSRPILELLEKLKADTTKYSPEDVSNGLRELETEESVEALLLGVLSYEKLASEVLQKLPPLPSNATDTQILQRAIDRCSELGAQDDSHWRRLEVAVKKARGGDNLAGMLAVEQLKGFREDLKRVGLNRIQKYVIQRSRKTDGEKQDEFLRIRQELELCTRLRERADTASATNDETQSSPDLAKTLDVEELMASFKWLRSLSKEQLDEFASNTAQRMLALQDKKLREEMASKSALLRTKSLDALELTIATLDQSESEQEREAKLEKIRTAIPEESKEGLFKLRSLVTECGKLLTAAHMFDFASLYPKAVESQSSRWIKTPCVVISKATGEASGTLGGHNVDAKVTRFEISAEGVVKPGKVQLRSKDGADVIVVSADDAAKIPAQVRLAATRFKMIEEIESRDPGDPILVEKVRNLRKQAMSELQVAIDKSKSPPLRTELAALKIPEGRSALIRGAAPPQGLNGTAPDFWAYGTWSDFRAAPEPIRAMSAQLREAGTPSIVVSRRSDGSIDLISPPAKYLRAGNPQSAIDFCASEIVGSATGSGSRVRIHLEGFSADENHAMLTSIRTRTAANVEGVYDIEAKSGATLKELNQALLTKFDFKRSSLKIETVETGVKAEIDIPVTGARANARMTIFVRVKNATKATLQKLSDTITAIVRAFQSHGDFSRDAISQLHIDIRNAAKELGDPAVDLKFESELGDFIIAHEQSMQLPVGSFASR